MYAAAKSWSGAALLLEHKTSSLASTVKLSLVCKKPAVMSGCHCNTLKYVEKVKVFIINVEIIYPLHQLFNMICQFRQIECVGSKLKCISN